MAERAMGFQNVHIILGFFLNFRRVGFGLFRDLLGRIPWETVLTGKGAQTAG